MPPTFELWRTDGSAAGTIKLTDQPAQRFNSFAAFGDFLIFSVDTLEDGNELFRSDGTRNGTYRLRDINASQANSRAVFAATPQRSSSRPRTASTAARVEDGRHGRRDGDAQGVRRAIRCDPIVGGDGRRRVLRRRRRHARPAALRSDGTAAGTRMVPAGAVHRQPGDGAAAAHRERRLRCAAFTPAEAQTVRARHGRAAAAVVAPPYISVRTLRVFGSPGDDVIRVTRRAMTRASST